MITEKSTIQSLQLLVYRFEHDNVSCNTVTNDGLSILFAFERLNCIFDGYLWIFDRNLQQPQIYRRNIPLQIFIRLNNVIEYGLIAIEYGYLQIQ